MIDTTHDLANNQKSCLKKYKKEAVMEWFENIEVLNEKIGKWSRTLGIVGVTFMLLFLVAVLPEGMRTGYVAIQGLNLFLVFLISVFIIPSIGLSFIEGHFENYLENKKDEINKRLNLASRMKELLTMQKCTPDELKKAVMHNCTWRGIAVDVTEVDPQVMFERICAESEACFIAYRKSFVEPPRFYFNFAKWASV
jgi:hypothetical protein